MSLVMSGEPGLAREAPRMVRAGEDIAALIGAIDPKLVTTIGENLEAADDRSRVVAAVSGALRIVDGTVSVESAVEVPGNLEHLAATVRSERHIIVRGDVLDLVHLRAPGSIWIEGLIEAADVHADGDVFVSGGIVQRGKGRCVAGGTVCAKFLSAAQVHAGGDVLLQTEASNSNVKCMGQFVVERGPVIGSTVIATAGARCQTLGSPAGTMTTVQVGIDEQLREIAATQVHEIQQLRTRSQRMHVIVEPLLRHQKHLTADGKDKATELLFEAKELRVETDAMLASLRAMHARAQAFAAAACIDVAGIIHPGVVLRFPGMQATVRNPIRGPVRVCSKDIDGQRVIVAMQEGAGRATRLEHEALADPVFEALERLLSASQA